MSEPTGDDAAAGQPTNPCAGHEHPPLQPISPDIPIIASHGHRDISAQLAEIDAGNVPVGRVLYKFYVLAPFSDEKGCLTPGCNSRGAESMQAACAPDMVVLMCLMCGGRRTAAALSTEVVI